VRIDDRLVDAHHGLAAALHALGRISEADVHAAKARQLQTQAPR
jgi:Flp pilus assembly protein TadD